MAAKTLGLGKASTGAAGGVTALAAAAAAATATIDVFSIKAAANFQTQLARIHTQADASNATVAKLRKGILDMTTAVATSPEQLASAAFHIASVGQNSLTAAQQLRILKVAAEGAKIGGADLVDVTNALDAAVVSGIRGVSNYSQAMGVLNATVGAGDMQMQDLADAFGPLGAVMKGYNVSIRQVGAALATFGDNNLRGAEAGTALRMAVQSLAVPVKSGQDLLKSWGDKAGNLANQLRHGGLTAALDTLYRLMKRQGISAKEVGDVLTQAFGKRAGIGLAVLMGELDRFHNKLHEVTKGATGFASSWAGYTKTFQYAWDSMREAVQKFAINIGTRLMPSAARVVNWMRKEFLPAAASTVEWVNGKLGPVFRELGKAIRWAFDQIAGTVRNNIDGFKTWGHVLEADGKIALWVAMNVGKILVGVFRTVIAVVGEVGKAFRALADFFSGAFLRAVGGLTSAFATALKDMADATLSFFSFFVHAASKALGWLPFGIGSAVKRGAAAFDSFRSDVDATLSGIIDDAGRLGHDAGASWATNYAAAADFYVRGKNLSGLKGLGKALGQDKKKPAPATFTFSGGSGVPINTPSGGGSGGSAGSVAANTLHVTAQKLVQALAHGLLKGWQGFSQTVEDSLSVGTRHLLNALGKQFQDIQDRMKKLVQDARTSLHNALRDERQYVQQIMNDASLTNVPTVASGYTGNPDRLTNIGAFLARQAKSYAQFNRALRRLAHMGVAKSLVNQISAMGPTQGLQYAQQIISGQAGSIAALNSYQKQIAGSAQAIGQDRYGAQVRADRKHLEHMVREQRQTNRYLSSLARQTGREVAKELGPLLAAGLTGKQVGLTPHEAREYDKALKRLARQLGK